jgi:hypothetical protein
LGALDAVPFAAAPFAAAPFAAAPFAANGAAFGAVPLALSGSVPDARAALTQPRIASVVHPIIAAMSSRLSPSTARRSASARCSGVNRRRAFAGCFVRPLSLRCRRLLLSPDPVRVMAPLPAGFPGLWRLTIDLRFT